MNMDRVQAGASCSPLSPSIPHLADQLYSILLTQRPFSNSEITDLH